MNKRAFYFFAIFVFIFLCSAALLFFSQNHVSEKGEPGNYLVLQRSFPYGKLNNQAYKAALISVKEESQKRQVTVPWNFAGDLNIGGRILDIEMPTSSTQIIYTCAATGGIFKSTDFGSTWKPIFDDALTQAVGDLAIAPSDENVLYAGTGDPGGGGGSITYDGMGVYRSSDAGNTWRNLGLDNSGSIGRIAVDPTNPNRAYVAAMGELFAQTPDRGIYLTTDGGNTWIKSLYISNKTGAIDVVINPQKPQTVFAAMWERTRTTTQETYYGPTSAIYRSDDGGTNWTKVTSSLPTGSMGRIGIDICLSNPNIMYAVYVNTGGGMGGVYKSSDGGTSWSRVNDSALNNVFSTYGWWFGRIKVDPLNPDIVYVIGFDTYKSTNGGSSWTLASSGTHVDHHAVFIHPKNNNIILNGNDGGMYKYSGGWVHFDNLPITQFYSCEIDNAVPTRLYGGAQDNGVIGTKTGGLSDWKQYVGGDGFQVLVDPTNNSYMYGESQNGALERSTNGGTSFSSATTGISGTTNWNTPICFNPKNPKTLFYGSNKVFRSVNRAVSWTAFSPVLPGTWSSNTGFGTITSISVSPIDTNIVYAGTDDGNVWMTKDYGKNWNRVSSSLPLRWVTNVTADPLKLNTAYVSYSGYRWHDSIKQLYMTNDLGQRWQTIGGNLPDVPINDIIVDPKFTSTLFAATDVGVYYTRDLGATWALMGDNLPKAPVLDLSLHMGTRILVAATFGRGMYKLALNVFDQITSTPENTINISHINIFPNPFTQVSKIGISSDQNQDGNIRIYDLSGKSVALLYSGNIYLGYHEYIWDGTNSEGTAVQEGVYIVVLRTDKGITSQKIILSH